MMWDKAEDQEATGGGYSQACRGQVRGVNEKRNGNRRQHYLGEIPANGRKVLVLVAVKGHGITLHPSELVAQIRAVAETSFIARNGRQQLVIPQLTLPPHKGA
jgi:hypothetical protein